MSRLAAHAVHCLTCGAPAIPLNASDASFCPYCGAYQTGSRGDANAEGVEIRNQLGDGVCPLCDVDLVRAIIAELPAATCTQCGGIRCSMEVFAQIIRARRADYSGIEDPPRALNAAELTRVVHCPSCRKRMDTHPYHGPGNVVIDVCTRCDVVWLDKGELTALERAPGKR